MDVYVYKSLAPRYNRIVTDKGHITWIKLHIGFLKHQLTDIVMCWNSVSRTRITDTIGSKLLLATLHPHERTLSPFWYIRQRGQRKLYLGITKMRIVQTLWSRLCAVAPGRSFIAAAPYGAASQKQWWNPCCEELLCGILIHRQRLWHFAECVISRANHH